VLVQCCRINHVCSPSWFGGVEADESEAGACQVDNRVAARLNAAAGRDGSPHRYGRQMTRRPAAYGLLQQPQPPQVDHSFQVPPPQFQTSTAQLQAGAKASTKRVQWAGVVEGGGGSVGMARPAISQVEGPSRRCAKDSENQHRAGVGPGEGPLIAAACAHALPSAPT